jgi:hypothetical protein
MHVTDPAIQKRAIENLAKADEGWEERVAVGARVVLCPAGPHARVLSCSLAQEAGRGGEPGGACLRFAITIR